MNFPVTITKYSEPLIVSAYSVEEILEFNRRHDQRYGWSICFPNFYTKPDFTCYIPAPPELSDEPIHRSWRTGL